MRRISSIFFLLLITGFSFAQNPVEDSSFFTPSAVFESTGLKNVESNKRLKVYAKSDDQPNDVIRTVDIRWVFSSKQEAAEFLEKNLEKESEGGYAMKKMISLPNSKENDDRSDCRKINNSDFIIEYAFQVGDNSVLAKGYKYCYMYATFKQNAADCYVVFLSDDTKKIGLFRQMHKSSIKYRN